MEEKKQHKQLGFIDCLGIGIGQIIGSGVMVLTGVVVGLTGHGAPGLHLRGTAGHLHDELGGRPVQRRTV